MLRRIVRLYRAEIHHPPWPLEPAEVDVRENTVAPVELEGDPVVHHAARQDVVIWALGPRRDVKILQNRRPIGLAAGTS